MEIEQIKKVVEGALLASSMPLSIGQLDGMFDEDEKPGHGLIKEALAALDVELADRAVELVEVGSGYRIQVRSALMPRIAKLWADKPPKYSRAMLETIAIIAYRQPITRAEIEQIRGVSVSSNILRTLQERDWIKIIGHRDVPGRPELLGTTRAFLDYFNIKSLNQLPTLAEIRDLENFEPELELNDPELTVPNTEKVPASETQAASDHNGESADANQASVDQPDVPEQEADPQTPAEINVTRH